MGKNVAIFSVALEDARNEDSIKELIEFLTPVMLEASLLDAEKIENDFHVSIEYVCIQTPTEWGFHYTGQKEPLIISMDTLQQKYVYTEVKEFTVIECEQLHYWRKDYHLQSQIYDLFPECEDLNVTYKRVAASDLQYLGIDVTEAEDSGLFYYEWY